MGKHDRRYGLGLALIAGILGPPAALAATPPPSVNYQGVLRDQNDAPLAGSFDMVLGFLDAASGGNEILVDRHSLATGNPVMVSDGLFNVALGSGTISDGSGPGTYTSLEAVFRDFAGVWLEVHIGAETLSPRTRIHSSPYALNTAQFDGRPASSFLDTSTTTQTKSGKLEVVNGANVLPVVKATNLAVGGTALQGNGGWGVRGNGDFTGGEFSGQEYGVKSFGSTYAGAYISGSNNAVGLWAQASSAAAGKFESFGSWAPSADIAGGNTGVTGRCTNSGGWGVEGVGDQVGVLGTASGNSGSGVNGSASGALGIGGSFSSNYIGVSASGNVAGRFTANSDPNSVGVRGDGTTGGWFTSPNSPGLSVLLATNPYGIDISGGGTGSVGIRATGGSKGGAFTASDSGSTGVSATGQAHGGFFQNAGGEYAHVASQGVGISAVGPSYGSYFANGSPWFSYAYVPSTYEGIHALGATVGGEFNNFATSSYALVGYATYKIIGIGAVSFVQNHPDDPSKVIVYAAPEGDEVAVYTRGSGKLVDGEARVKLGETFAHVTNPDVGLTATATPRGGEPIPLVVVELSTGEMFVRGPKGSNAAFDYMVWGLRIGFEEQSIVQPKQRESKIPPMHEHERFFEEDPTLRSYTALARFTDDEKKVRGRSEVNLERAHRLRDAVGVFPQGDPLDEPIEGPGRLEPSLPHGEGPSAPAARETKEQPAAPPVAVLAGGSKPLPPRDDGDLFDVVGAVAAGDVVSLVDGAPGAVAVSTGPDDALVVGCALENEPTARGRVAVAWSRIALCRVDASFGAVAVGDRLIASPIPGTAMKAGPETNAAAALGRAIDPLASGAEVIRVLLGAR